MAMYFELPVYIDSVSLLTALDRVTAKMARDYKYTAGQHMRQLVIDIIVLLYKANRDYDKRPSISLAREKLVEVQVICRMLSAVGQVSDKQFMRLSEKTAIVGKQLSAWEKSLSQNNSIQGAGQGMKMPESPDQI